MTLPMLIWAANAGLLTIASFVLVRELDLGERFLNALALAFLWIFLATLQMFVLGLVGWLDVAHLGWVTIAGSVLCCLLPSARGTLRSLPAAFRREWRKGRRWFRQQPSWLQWFLGVSAVLGFVRFAFVIVVYPPFVWDSLTYHLTNVAAWTQRGAIFIPDTPVSRTYLPADYETLTTWFTVFLHDDIVIEASGLTAYVLQILGVYALSRSLGSSVTASTLASAGMAFTPSILLTATGTKNDPFMAGYFLALMALTVSISFEAHRPRSSELLHRLILMLMIVLLAAGTKAYIAYMLPGLVLTGGLLLVDGGCWQALRGPFASARSSWQERTLGWKSLIVGLTLTAAVLGGFWNVRNWLLTGDPFYPYGVAVGGRTVIVGAANQFHFSLGRLFENLANIVGKLGDGLAPIQPDLPNTTGWGWFGYVLGVPSLLWSVWRNPKMRWVFVGFIGSALAILMSTRPSPYNMRYIIWFPAVLAVAFAVTYDALLSHRLPVRRFASLLFVASLALNFPMTITQNIIRIPDVVSMLKLPALHRDAARFHVHVPQEYENALTYVPENALLGYNVTPNGFVYPLFRADFSQHIVFVPFTADNTCQQIARRMDSRKTRYLFVAPEQTDDAKLGALNACARDGTYLRERARGVYVLNDR